MCYFSLLNALRRGLLILLLLAIGCYLPAQVTPTGTAVFTARIIDKESEEPIEGVTVAIEGTNLATSSDTAGVITLQGIPPGEQSVVFSLIGYYRKKIKQTFPRTDTVPLTVKLESIEEELDEVVVVSTRNEKKTEDLPTRVEVISEAEVDERMSDKPSDVSHVLREQPGVQVQRTSATGGTMSIRLQGLRSRYVQVLKDGFPVFGGFANVIGITQIPPLDIKQVEIIKGPASTLYGGDAIAGVINLISKEPSEKPVYDIMVNAESSKAVDAGAYASQKFKWFGFSVMGLYRWQKEKDWNGDRFSETPRLQRYSVNPQLYFEIRPNVKLNIGAAYTHENRTGGAIAAIAGKSDTTYNYYERNLSNHLATNLKFQYSFGGAGKLTLKNSVNYFKRDLQLPYYLFKGQQLSSASEINYHWSRAKHDLVVGLDFRTDKFSEAPDSAGIARNYNFYTGGLFLQYSYTYNNRATFEGGMRLDYNNRYKIYALPHLAWKQKWNDIFTTRLNVAMGYKLPTIFQDESEEARFINVRSIGDSVRPELSLGGTLDLLVKIPSNNGVNVSINQMYFVTHIFKPMLPQTKNIEGCSTGDCQALYYMNVSGWQRSLGVETSLRIGYRGFDASLTYTLTDNNFKVNEVRSIAPLTSKHILSMLVGYEIKNFAAGIDCYYYSPVKLSNGNAGHGIWEFGIVTQYSYKFLLLFANLENVFDIRQTSFGPIVQPGPTYSHPTFSEIYAPLEGRLFNAGFKLRLGMLSKKYRNDEGGVERLKGKID